MLRTISCAWFVFVRLERISNVASLTCLSVSGAAFCLLHRCRGRRGCHKRHKPYPFNLLFIKEDCCALSRPRVSLPSGTPPPPTHIFAATMTFECSSIPWCVPFKDGANGAWFARTLHVCGSHKKNTDRSGLEIILQEAVKPAQRMYVFVLFVVLFWCPLSSPDSSLSPI